MTSDAPWNERPHSDLQVISGGKADDVVALRPPTGKEERFIQEVLGGSSLAEAYRRAYSAQNMSASNTRTEASRVAARPHVSQALHWPAPTNDTTS
jgi:hypothetical protein